MMGVGFGAVLVVLGAIRELLGTGALFANMDLLFGPMAASWTLVLSDNYVGFLLAILPPGAFIITGLLIAAKNIIDARIERQKKIEVVEAGSKRVRVVISPNERYRQEPVYPESHRLRRRLTPSPLRGISN